jgi:acetyl-CoA carboxylase biotin carboxyl carrier protein
MELSDIVELVNLVAARDIAQFEVETEGFRLRIVKPEAAPAPRALSPPGGGVVVAPPVAVERMADRALEAEATPAAIAEPGLFTMKAPIVGTLYRAPSPAAEPYVKVGDRVKKGQVLCIIEAMKLMNEIEAEASGIVADVLVQDGQPVEYGEPLFTIRPDK